MNIRAYINRNKYECIFGGLLIGMMLVYSFPFLIRQGPKGFHIWRQTDGLSFARHYYDNGLDFSDPQIFHLLFKEHSSAQTVGEFPGVYYAVAALWKVFGVHEWIFRLVTLCISMGGLIAAHRLLREITNQPFWSSWIVAILFTSPAIAFYAAGFIPDMHAISFSLIATYLFYRHSVTHKLKFIYLSALLFALAGLIKPTALIPFFALGAVLLFESIPFFSKKSVVWFHARLHAFLAFALVIVANLVWILWVRHYNNTYGGWFTPHEVFMPWNYPADVLKNFMGMFREFLVNQLFSRSTLFLLLSVLVILVFSWKWLEGKARLLLALVVAGSAAYVLLFFKWDVHDYYALVLIPLPLVILGVAFRSLSLNQTPWLNWKPLRYFALCFLLYNCWYCASNLQMRINPKDEKQYLSSASKPEVELFKYLMWSYEQKFAAMKDAEPFLNSLGIGPDDLIVSLPDDSFNASLYLLHRRGWTSYESDVYSVDGMQQRIDRGAKYLVVNDLEAAKKFGLPDKFLMKEIGGFKNLHIFKLP